MPCFSPRFSLGQSPLPRRLPRPFRWPRLTTLAVFVGLLGAVGLVAGCHSHPPAVADAAPAKVYHLRGKVVSTDPAHGELTVDHEAIPGFMEAMTMPYKMKNPAVLSELHTGDVFTADVLVPADPNADPLLDHIVVVSQARPDYKPRIAYHLPTPGDLVPDFRLRNQDGRPLHLGQFRGRALVLTFLYTRCPSPEFCPRIMSRFAELNRLLAANPALAARSHLLGISFDPAHDTPARLRAYAEPYLGGDDFSRWELALPERPAELEPMARFFNLALSPAPDGSITHSLSTTLIGPDGRVARFYPGNEWTSAQLAADLRQSLGL